MKTVENVKYLIIGEVSSIINRSPKTIKNWYAWYNEQAPEVQHANPLPKIYVLDEKCSRYFREEDIPMLERFKDNIRYGKMSDFNVNLWGKRGKEILSKGSGGRFNAKTE